MKQKILFETITIRERERGLNSGFNRLLGIYSQGAESVGVSKWKIVKTRHQRVGGFLLNRPKRNLAKGRPRTLTSKGDLIRYGVWEILSKLT